MRGGDLFRDAYERQGYVYFSARLPDRRVLALFRSRQELEVKFQTSQPPPPFSNKPRCWSDAQTEVVGSSSQADHLACEWMSAEKVVER